MKNWFNLYNFCLLRLASRGKTPESAAAGYFHLFCLEEQISWLLKKIAVICIRSIKFISLGSVYEHPENVSCRDFSIWTCAVTLSDLIAVDFLIP